jgi:hypothetical protein
MINIGIKMYKKTPAEWKGKTPIETYETKLLITGFSRYNLAKRTISQIFRYPDGHFEYTEQLCDIRLFPRVYHTEDMQVFVYSRSPLVWKEEVGVGDYYFFVQQPMQTAST